jgi:hypothetical protein
MKTKKSFLWLDRRIAKDGPHLTLVRTEKDYLKAMKHLKCKQPPEWVNPGANATAHVMNHTENGSLCCVVAVRITPENTGIEIAGLLVHEAVHITDEYFASMGEKYPAMEQRAYAVQVVSSELMWEYQRQVSLDV